MPLTVTIDDVDNARREAGLDDEVAEALGSQRRDFGRLEGDQWQSSNVIGDKFTFRTIVLPVASAGPSFHPIISYI